MEAVKRVSNTHDLTQKIVIPDLLSLNTSFHFEQ